MKILKNYILEGLFDDNPVDKLSGYLEAEKLYKNFGYYENPYSLNGEPKEYDRKTLNLSIINNELHITKNDDINVSSIQIILDDSFIDELNKYDKIICDTNDRNLYLINYMYGHVFSFLSKFEWKNPKNKNKNIGILCRNSDGMVCKNMNIKTNNFNFICRDVHGKLIFDNCEIECKNFETNTLWETLDIKNSEIKCVGNFQIKTNETDNGLGKLFDGSKVIQIRGEYKMEKYTNTPSNIAKIIYKKKDIPESYIYYTGKLTDYFTEFTNIDAKSYEINYHSLLKFIITKDKLPKNNHLVARIDGYSIGVKII
jgi:hypothetical protein